ncbi:MAG: mobile mystery protein A [Parcubacteria group bacterium]
MTVINRAARALDRRLQHIAEMSSRPPKGWIRAIRDALGLTTRQYAARLGVHPSRVGALEKGEVDETVTLQSLRRAAEALDCQLVYALVPNRPLAAILRQRAEQKADEQLQRVGHTMQLENQEVSSAGHQQQREQLVDQLLRGNLRRLWDETA